MKMDFWPYSVDTYDLFLLLKKNPRITKHTIAKNFHVNDKTAASWLDACFKKKILLTPEFRKKAFINFREYFYYLNVRDPHRVYEKLIDHENEIRDDIIHFSVQTGFCNFQIVSNKELDFSEEITHSGARSDYFISAPKNVTFRESIEIIRGKLSAIETIKVKSSPLVYHDSLYKGWNETSEKIYMEFSENLRKSFKAVLKNTGATRNTILDWIKKRNRFGHTILMYFPDGLSAYQPTVYCLETDHDYLLIDIFSSLPVPAVFFRIGEKLMMKIYLKNDSLEGKYISFKVMSDLRKKELVKDYTNSVVQYYYRF